MKIKLDLLPEEAIELAETMEALAGASLCEPLRRRMLLYIAATCRHQAAFKGGIISQPDLKRVCRSCGRQGGRDYIDDGENVVEHPRCRAFRLRPKGD